MTKWQRFKNVLLVILQALIILLMLYYPQYGKGIVLLMMEFILTIYGIRYLIFYFTMARYMVDGKSILYKGGICLDLGILLGMLSRMPSAYLMLYIIGYFALIGIYRCMRIIDKIRIEDQNWMQMIIVASWYLILALVGILNFTSETVMVYLFCIEMAQSAFARLARVFRKTAIVYIQ